MRIIKNNVNNVSIESYGIEEFQQSSDRGESNFNFQPFDGSSVQDESFRRLSEGVQRPQHRTTEQKASQDLFGGYFSDTIDGEEPVNFEMPDFAEETETTENINSDKKIVEENQTLKDPNDQSSDDGFSDMEISELSADNINVPESQKDLSKINSLEMEIERLTDENRALLARIEELKASSETKINELKESSQAALDEAKKESELAVAASEKAGYEKGFNTAKEEARMEEKRQYEAQQADYLSTVEKSLDNVSKEIDNIKEILNIVDHNMPEIVLGYVRELIGSERVLNDKFILNVVSSVVDKLKTLQNVVFTVNPDDAGVLSERYPQFGVTMDPSVAKGTVKVHTNIGDMDLDVDSWMNDLKKKIDEQFKASSNI